MTGWAAAVWPTAVAALALTVPGLLLCLALRLRASAWGVAPALSLGVLAVAVGASGVTGMVWGAALVAGVSLVLAVVAAALRFGVARFGLARAGRIDSLRGGPLTRVRNRAAADPVVADRPAYLWTALAGLVASAGALAWVVATGIERPDAVNQTYDGPFHVNAVAAVAASARATPGFVAAVARPGSPETGFYPSLFHAVGGLVVQVTGVDAMTAANLVGLVVAALVWPPSVWLLLRTVLGPSRLALVVGLTGGVLISLFPVLPLTFGVLWPNALSLAVVPAVVALLAHVLQIAPHRVLGTGTAAALGVVTMPGLYLAHPGAAFVVMALAIPMVLASWGTLAGWAWGRGTRGRALAAGSLLALVLGAWAVWVLLDRIPSLRSVRTFDWKARASLQHAVGEVVTLGSPITPELLVYGALTVIGLVLALRGRLWWLAAGHVLLCTLAVLAISQDTGLSQRLTGFWYNDPLRILAPIPVTALPLAALAAVAVRDALATGIARLAGGEDQTPARASTRSRARWAASGITVLVIALLLPSSPGLARVAEPISRSYARSGDKLVTPGEERLYRSLAEHLAPGQSVAGNPWGGAVYAGVLSGHPTLWNHLSIRADSDRALLAERFRDFTTDPQVCAADKRLGVGAVVEDTDLLWPNDPRSRSYPGFTGLADVTGLTLLGTADTASAYLVGPCSG